MNEPQTPNRRGFIKGIVAGLAGAFFALRGAEPAEAAATSSSPITQVSIATPELISEISPTDLARLDELNNKEELTEAESIELTALSVEMDRRTDISDINYSYHFVMSYRSVRLRPGQYTMLVLTFKERGTLRYLLVPHYRLRIGFYPELDAVETSLEGQTLSYETAYGQPYIPPRY